MSKNEKQYGFVTFRVWDFADLVLNQRFARALDEGAARYPVFRELRFAARIESEVLLDAIALDPEWRAQRLNRGALILDAEGLFVVAYRCRPPAEAAGGRQRPPAPLPDDRGRRGARAGAQDHLLDQPCRTSATWTRR
jgi:hypothetical protein